MPGIVGLITLMPREQARSELVRMLEVTRHSPSYRIGTWIDEALGIYIAWSEREGSFADGMPLRNERGDLILFFSGEEFPEPGTELRLKRAGHELGAKGPSYLVHLCEEDPGFPAGLNGRFHGLYADRTRGRAVLFNDRYGGHRVYYHTAKRAFYFAAEAKSILAVRPELRSVDPRSLAEFVSCGCVLENRTLFEDLQVLPPAAAWVFRNGALASKASYFAAGEWVNQEPLAPECYYQELRETFTSNLPRYFKAGERVGMSLTGGLDTRMIMAWQRHAPGTLPCYSFGGTYRKCQDILLARQVATTCGQPYEVIPVGTEFLSRFAEYAERTVYLTDGCTPVNFAPNLYCNELAAKIAPVRMTGNYGGEILRRLRSFKPVEVCAQLYRPEFLNHVRSAFRTYGDLLAEHPGSFVAFRQVPWYHHAVFALEQTQVSLRSPFLDNDLVRTAFRAPNAARAARHAFEDSDDCVRLIADGNADLRRIRTDRGFAARGGLAGAVSKNWLEFTFKAEYAYDYGMPQWLARSDHFFSWLRLERLFLGRHKFTHFRVWYRDILSEYVREILLDRRTVTRPYLNPQGVESIVNEHLRGVRNYTSEIHQLLTLELLFRIMLDPSCKGRGSGAEILS
jgi:asparagine synthase (glutamine-hydrolysing)